MKVTDINRYIKSKCVCDDVVVTRFNQALWWTISIEKGSKILEKSVSNTQFNDDIFMKLFLDDMIDMFNKDYANVLDADSYYPRLPAFTDYDRFFKKNPDHATTLSIKNVCFNDPLTVVIWSDGTKTFVKAHNEEYDPEKGLAMAIAKKFLGNKYDYHEQFEKWLGKCQSN